MSFSFYRRLSIILQVVILSLAFISTPAFAVETWRLAHKMPADSPEGRVHQHFADLVEQYSAGDLKILVFPNEQLGKESSVLEQLQLGTIQIYAEATFFLQKWVPDLRWMTGSFLFDDRAHWVRFMNTPLVKGWLAEAEQKSGIMPLGNITDVVRGPYRVLVTTKPVHGLGELTGLKLRMYPDKLATEVWTNLGVEPRMLGWTDTYEGLKSGLVEGVTSPIALVDSMRFYEVAKYAIRTNEFYQELGYMTNARAFKGLSPRLQDALLRAHRETAVYSEKVMQDAAATALQNLKSHGATYEEIDLAPIVRKTKDWYTEQDKAGQLPHGFLDAVNATRNNR